MTDKHRWDSNSKKRDKIEGGETFRLANKSLDTSFLLIADILNRISDKSHYTLFDSLTTQCIYIANNLAQAQSNPKRRRKAAEKNLTRNLENAIRKCASHFIDNTRINADNLSLGDIRLANERYMIFLAKLGPACTTADGCSRRTNGCKRNLALRAEAWFLEDLVYEMENDVLHCVLQTLDRARQPDSPTILIENLCWFFNKSHQYSLTFPNGSERQNVLKLYENNLSRFVQIIRINFNASFIGNLKALITKETRIASAIRFDLAEEARSKVIQHTILDASVLQYLMSEIISNIAKYDEIRQNLIELHDLFHSCDKLQQLISSLSDCLIRYFADSLHENQYLTGILEIRDIIDFFETYLKSFSCDFKIFSKNVRNSIMENTDEKSTFVRVLVKNLDKFFKQSYKSKICPSIEAQEWIDAIPGVLAYMGIESDVLKYYLSESLMRRMFLMNINFLEKFCNPDAQCIERRFCKMLITEFEEKATNLKKILRDFESSFHLITDNHDCAPQIIPLILEKHAVPRAYHDSMHEKYPIPRSLQTSWEACIKRYLTQSLENRSKKISNAYKLHRLELSSPFELPNGDRLIFELNLPQAAVLECFNARLKWSRDQMFCEFERFDLEIIRKALRSFVKAGLLIEDRCFYELNQDFIPELKEVRHGKLMFKFTESL